jgi:protein-disulfide isomerase
MMHKHLRVSWIFWAIGATALSIFAQSANLRAERCLGGSPDAPIRLEVFSDFQCPACQGFYMETIRQVLKDYCRDGKVCVMYYEYPLPMHPYAREAARYSLAAQGLGQKQWAAVVDAIYANQPKWSLDGNITPFVAQAVTPEEFQKMKKTLEEPSVEEAIVKDIGEGQKRGVQSTPTMFVTAQQKEQKVVGGIEFPVLKDFFNRFLK